MDIQKANVLIKHAWIAGVVTGCLTLVGVLIAIIMGIDFIKGLGLDQWAFIDVFIILALSFGVYKKSRLCAVLLFIYFVGCKIIMFMEISNIRIHNLFLPAIFSILFFQGIRGTFAFHKNKALSS